ncbi:MAG: phosphatase [Chlorobiaceae bacterium]|nr:phosphatase [Chlorobiaceae bacterium]
MLPRTSQSHPLQIAEIPLSPGMIGLTFCPGKQGNSLFGTPWARNLEIDISAIQDWGAAVIVTLMEQFELDLLGVPHLGNVIQEAGIEWVHLPIRDISVPDETFQKDWPSQAKALQRRLSNGEHILFHCRGGLGRTGLVAGLLLLDLGWDANNAINTVREVRPGAIETTEQENYVRNYLPCYGCDSPNYSTTTEKKSAHAR